MIVIAECIIRVRRTYNMYIIYFVENKVRNVQQ